MLEIIIETDVATSWSKVTQPLELQLPDLGKLADAVYDGQRTKLTFHEYW